MCTNTYISSVSKSWAQSVEGNKSCEKSTTKHVKYYEKI